MKLKTESYNLPSQKYMSKPDEIKTARMPAITLENVKYILNKGGFVEKMTKNVLIYLWNFLVDDYLL